MSLNDELNKHFLDLISNKSGSVNLELLRNTEKAFYQNELIFLKRFLGVLYFFNNEYLLSYLLLDGEEDNISRFYFIYSLIYLGYHHLALETFSRYKNDSILKNKQIDLTQRVKLSFLLNRKITFSEVSNDPLTNALTSITSRNSFDQIKGEFKNVIYNTCDTFLIAELKKRIEGEKENCNLSYNIFKHNYSDNFFKISSYSETIGNNMTLIKINGQCFIVDCGADIKEPSISFDDFFEKNDVKKDDIKAIFFTHSHLDHIGNSLNLLNYLNNSTPCYLTVDTMQLAGYGNEIYLSEKNHLKFITTNAKVQVGNGVDVTFINNGHIIGSSSLLFEFNGKKAFFTSDFCLHDQTTVQGMNIRNVLSFCGHDVDYLITESTYGTATESLRYEDSWELYKILIIKLYTYGKNVFMPAYSIGRTQELFNGINECPELNNCSINILGRANNVTLYYKNLNKSSNKNNYCDRDNPLLYDFIIASSGMLVEDSESNVLIKNIIANDLKNVVLIQTGYIDPNQAGSQLIKEWKNANKLFFEINLSAHASKAEIHRLIDALNPKTIVSIHGDGIK